MFAVWHTFNVLLRRGCVLKANELMNIFGNSWDHLVSLILILFLGILPIIFAMIAGLISKLFGHELTECGPPKIPIIGRILYSFGVMGWFSLITVPMSAFAFVAYLIGLVLGWV